MTNLAIALTCVAMFVLFVWAIRDDKPDEPENAPDSISEK